MKPFLKDDLVQLRALEPSDIDLLYRWENDEEIWTVSHTLSPYSRHLLTQFIANSDKDIYENKQLRMIIATYEGKAVGAIDLFDFDPHHLRVGLGILIHGQEDRTKGYATAALQLMIRFCFEKLHLHQIYANILTDNLISMKLFAKAGFELAGTKREWIREGDHWKDENLMTLINERMC